MNNNTYELFLKKLSVKYGKPVLEIKKIVESQFEFISETLKKIDFKNIKSKESFDKIGTNFNIRYLFTLYTTYSYINKINKRRNEATSSHIEKSRPIH